MRRKKVIRLSLMIIIFIIILLLGWSFLGGKSYSKYRDEMNASSEIGRAHV